LYCNEGKISAGLFDLLPKGYFKNVGLAAKARTSSGMDNAYVFMPNVVALFDASKKIDKAVLDLPVLAKYMYCPGLGSGSLVDLVLQKCRPCTEFPNIAVGVWTKPSVIDSGASGKRRGSARGAGGRKSKGKK